MQSEVPSYTVLTFGGAVPDVLKEIVRDVKRTNVTLGKHEEMLEEILMRLRNKGTVLVHPDGMPSVPPKSMGALEDMEESLKRSA